MNNEPIPCSAITNITNTPRACDLYEFEFNNNRDTSVGGGFTVPDPRPRNRRERRRAIAIARSGKLEKARKGGGVRSRPQTAR